MQSRSWSLPAAANFRPGPSRPDRSSPTNTIGTVRLARCIASTLNEPLATTTSGELLSRSASDIILDFFNSTTEADKIRIIKSGFLIPARIAVDAAVAADDFGLHYFVDGAATAGNAPAATEAHGQFLFNTTSNELFWDSNGTAAGGTTLIATLNTALQATDFELR